MTISIKLPALAGAIALAASAAFAQSTDTETTAPAAPAAEAAADRPLFANPFDPSTWWDGTDGLESVVTVAYIRAHTTVDDRRRLLQLLGRGVSIDQALHRIMGVDRS